MRVRTHDYDDPTYELLPPEEDATVHFQTLLQVKDCLDPSWILVAASDEPGEQHVIFRHPTTGELRRIDAGIRLEVPFLTLARMALPR